MSSQPALTAWKYKARISLRALMIITLMIGGGLGFIVNRARTQRVAVAAIKSAGGNVLYEWQWKNGRALRNGKPWWPQWLRNQVGIDYLEGS